MMYRPDPMKQVGRKWSGDPDKGIGQGVTVGCGRCPMCVGKTSGQWKTRFVCEGSLHDPASIWFTTFTLADEHLPDDFSVCPREAQLLVKRVRNEFGSGIRFYLIGEYGDPIKHTGRPHYHALFWGLPLDDLVPADLSQGGFPQWTSERLSKCWDKGRVVIGNADDAALSYIAGYIHKKMGGMKRNGEFRNSFQKHWYLRPHSATGELVQVRPEFAQMSRRPGIGHGWAMKYQASDLQHDFTVINGKKVGMPNYFKNLRYQLLGSDELVADAKEEAQVEALEAAKRQARDLTPERLATREEHYILSGQRLARGYGR